MQSKLRQHYPCLCDLIFNVGILYKNQVYPPMSTLAKDLNPDNMTREEFYFSRDYSIEGYEPVPTSRLILDPAHCYPDMGEAVYHNTHTHTQTARSPVYIYIYIYRV